MKPLTTLAVVLGFATGCLQAASTTFQEHNFALKTPDGWASFAPPIKEIIFSAKSPDEKTTVFVAAQKAEKNELAYGADDVSEGIRRSWIKQGWRITDEGLDFFNPNSYLVLRADLPNGGTASSYCVQAGEEVYAIQIVSTVPKGDRTAEAESIVSDFRLLTDKPIKVEKRPKVSDATRLGFALGMFMRQMTLPVLILILIGVVVWLARGQFSSSPRRRRRR